MKNLIPLLLLTLVLTSFNSIHKSTIGNTKYAFITDTEQDEAYDEDCNNGYIKIVSVECNLAIVLQLA